MSAPHAYLLTWTTFGTWLHGYPRGSADREHNRYGTRHLPPDPGRRAFERGEFTSAFRLCDEGREIVTATLEAHAAHRAWVLHARTVRSNHVHLVVSCNRPPEVPLREFKAWATRKLREKGLVGSNQKVWTRHGSTRYLFDESAFHGAVAYVEGHEKQWRDRGK